MNRPNILTWAVVFFCLEGFQRKVWTILRDVCGLTACVCACSQFEVLSSSPLPLSTDARFFEDNPPWLRVGGRTRKLQRYHQVG